MGYTCFDVSESDHVAHIQLNRPDKLNSMIPEFWTELPADRALDQRRGSGAGHRHLLDRQALLRRHGPVRVHRRRVAVRSGSDPGRHAIDRAGAQAGPAAGDGAAAAGHLHRARAGPHARARGHPRAAASAARVDMVTACDLRYASADAFFVDPGDQHRHDRRRRDLAAAAQDRARRASPASWPTSEGACRPQRAYEVGLVNELFDDHDALVAGTLDRAAQIAAKSPLAIWGSKEMITYARDHSVADGLNYIATWQTGMFQPADMMETFAAKSEGREPNSTISCPAPTACDRREPHQLRHRRHQGSDRVRGHASGGARARSGPRPTCSRSTASWSGGTPAGRPSRWCARSQPVSSREAAACANWGGADAGGGLPRRVDGGRGVQHHRVAQLERLQRPEVLRRDRAQAARRGRGLDGRSGEPPSRRRRRSGPARSAAGDRPLVARCLRRPPGRSPGRTRPAGPVDRARLRPRRGDLGGPDAVPPGRRGRGRGGGGRPRRQQHQRRRGLDLRRPPGRRGRRPRARPRLLLRRGRRPGHGGERHRSRARRRLRAGRAGRGHAVTRRAHRREGRRDALEQPGTVPRARGRAASTSSRPMSATGSCSRS